jgi:hypothetical protein
VRTLWVGGAFRGARRVRFLRGRYGAQIDRRGRRRLAAERIVADDRPQHKGAEEQGQQAGNGVRYRDREFAPRLARRLAERGAQFIGGHGRTLGPVLGPRAGWRRLTRPLRSARPRRRGPSGCADELKPSIWIPACAGMSGESDRAFPDEAVANHASHFITAGESPGRKTARANARSERKNGAARRRPASICFPRRLRPRIWVSVSSGPPLSDWAGRPHR